MNLTSDFALLSIKGDRTKLATHFEEHPKTRIPITIVGYIDGIWGQDDGTDQEFTVTVEHLSTKKPFVEYTVACITGAGVLPTFDNLPDAIARAKTERETKRLASISRSISVIEPLFSSTDQLPK